MFAYARILYIFLVFSCCQYAHAQQQAFKRSVEVESNYNSRNSSYQTKGKVVIPSSYRVVGKVGRKFDAYRNWALKNINGGPGNPKGFISILKDLRYNEAKKYFLVIYDVDLVFPFGRSDRELNFRVLNLKESQGVLSGYSIGLDETSAVISDFSLKIKLGPAGKGQTVVEFESFFKLRWVFNQFFNLEKYKENVEFRILTIIENLKNHTKKAKA